MDRYVKDSDYNQRECHSRRGGGSGRPRTRDARSFLLGFFDAQDTSARQATLWRATSPHFMPFVTYPTQPASPVPDPTTSSATPDPTLPREHPTSIEYLDM
jgi:hypothetical protein